MKTQGFFLVFVLCLTLGLQYANTVFRTHFSDEKQLLEKITQLNKQKEQEAIKVALAQEQIQDLRTFALNSLGEKKLLTWQEKQWQMSARSPASIPNQNFELQSQLNLGDAKKSFQEKSFEAASVKLKKFIEKYPLSSDVIQAHFLLAESYFLDTHYEESLDVIDRMMTLYPDSDLTGFIMLRMGQILEKKNRQEEAIVVYQTVSEMFPKNKNLQDQIQARLYSSSRMQ